MGTLSSRNVGWTERFLRSPVVQLALKTLSPTYIPLGGVGVFLFYWWGESHDIILQRSQK